jgi:hypothetical protein
VGDLCDDERWAALAGRYGCCRAADVLSGPHPETGTSPEPVVTTSLRLPRRLMAGLRAEADRCGMKPSALIIQILERELAGDLAGRLDLEQRVSALEDAVRHLSR